MSASGLDSTLRPEPAGIIENVCEKEKYCEDCGTSLAANDRFCPECGAPSPPPPVISTSGFCDTCGKALSQKDKFCQECGSPVAGEIT